MGVMMLHRHQRQPARLGITGGKVIRMEIADHQIGLISRYPRKLIDGLPEGVEGCLRFSGRRYAD